MTIYRPNNYTSLRLARYGSRAPDRSLTLTVVTTCHHPKDKIVTRHKFLVTFPVVHEMLTNAK